LNSTKLKKQRRQFFVGVGLFLISFGVWKTFKEVYPTAPILLTSGALLLCIEFLFNSLAQAMFNGWMAFARLLGFINTTILLTIIYYTLVCPMALVRRWKERKNPSEEERFKANQSSWTPVEFTAQGPQDYFKPY